MYGKVYAGLTRNLNTRDTKHFSDLRTGRHGNRKLKNYWKKYGEGSLEYLPMFECPIEHLGVMERKIIENLDLIDDGLNITTGGENGYNPELCVEVTLTSAKTHKTVTAESITEFSQLYGISKSAVGRLVKGKQHMASEWFNPAFPWRPTYKVLTDPNGVEHLYYRLSDFCKEHNLNFKNMQSLTSGESNITKDGWSRPDSKENALCRSYELLDPNDKLVAGTSISKLQKQTGLFYGSLSSLIRGEIDYYKGWRRADNPNAKSNKILKTFKIESPTGEIIETTNLAKFCRENNLSKSALNRVFKGIDQQCKGWKLPGVKIKPNVNACEFKLKSPEGEIFSGFNLRAFATSKNLSYKTLWAVEKGKKKSYIGWTKA